MDIQLNVYDKEESVRSSGQHEIQFASWHRCERSEHYYNQQQNSPLWQTCPQVESSLTHIRNIIEKRLRGVYIIRPRNDVLTSMQVRRIEKLQHRFYGEKQHKIIEYDVEISRPK